MLNLLLLMTQCLLVTLMKARDLLTPLHLGGPGKPCRQRGHREKCTLDLILHLTRLRIQTLAHEQWLQRTHYGLDETTAASTPTPRL